METLELPPVAATLTCLLLRDGRAPLNVSIDIDADGVRLGTDDNAGLRSHRTIRHEDLASALASLHLDAVR